jgi:hypothetical protein
MGLEIFDVTFMSKLVILNHRSHYFARSTLLHTTTVRYRDYDITIVAQPYSLLERERAHAPR